MTFATNANCGSSSLRSSSYLTSFVGLVGGLNLSSTMRLLIFSIPWTMLFLLCPKPPAKGSFGLRRL